MLKEQARTITPCNVIVVLRIQQIENFGCKGGVVRSGVSEIVQPESFVVYCGVIIFVAIPLFFVKKQHTLHEIKPTSRRTSWEASTPARKFF